MMALNGINQWILSSLVTYGVPLLLALTYIGSLGIPFPNTMVILAAGAFSRYGIIDWRLAAAACLAGAVLADNSEYLLGRLAIRRLEGRFAQSKTWLQAQSAFSKKGGWAIVLTRFWLMPLAPAVNLMAGHRTSYWRFLGLDLAGQMLWVILYGGLGYLFMEKWDNVNQAMSGFSIASFAFVIVTWVVITVVQKRKSRDGVR